jgi:hypothetical protein
MRSMVDLSMRKTIARLDDFRDDPDTKLEILTTLASLDRFHQLIDSIYENNKDLIEEENNA